ncbi:MAG: hypothetical protein ACLQVJ_12140 [Syntrophobacteraceae bacterium]
MSKKLTVAMALSLVLVSGSLFTAQADCYHNSCGWQLTTWHSPSCFSCSAKDMDRRDADSANNPARFETDNGTIWPPGQ